MQWSAVQYNAVKFNAVQFCEVHNVVGRNAVTLQSMRVKWLRQWSPEQFTVSICI